MQSYSPQCCRVNAGKDYSLSANLLIEPIRTLVILRGLGIMKWEVWEGFEQSGEM